LLWGGAHYTESRHCQYMQEPREPILTVTPHRTRRNLLNDMDLQCWKQMCKMKIANLQSCMSLHSLFSRCLAALFLQSVTTLCSHCAFSQIRVIPGVIRVSPGGASSFSSLIVMDFQYSQSR